MAIQEIVSIGNKYRTMSSGEQKIWKRMSFWTKASDVEFNDGTTAEEKLGTVDADLLSTQGELDRFKENLTKNLTKIANAINKYVTTSTTASVDTMVSNIPKIYAKGQSDLKVARKLTLKANQTGNNVDITDNWYTTCDASAVYTQGKASATISSIDANKISVYLLIHEETHIYGGEHVGGNATLKVTLPDGTSGTKSLSDGKYTSNDLVVSASNETLASGIVLNSMELTCRDRHYATVEATFTVTYMGATSKIYCKLNSDNNQSGEGPTSSWYGDGESTRYILVSGNTGYQKLPVSNGTLQMM